MIVNLKKYRTHRGLTQKELASKLGLTKNAITMYETGKRSPSIAVTKKISEVLDVSIDSLVNEEHSNYNPEPNNATDEPIK